MSDGKNWISYGLTGLRLSVFAVILIAVVAVVGNAVLVGVGEQSAARLEDTSSAGPVLLGALVLLMLRTEAGSGLLEEPSMLPMADSTTRVVLEHLEKRLRSRLKMQSAHGRRPKPAGFDWKLYWAPSVESSRDLSHAPMLAERRGEGLEDWRERQWSGQQDEPMFSSFDHAAVNQTAKANKGRQASVVCSSSIICQRDSWRTRGRKREGNTNHRNEKKRNH